MNKIDLPFPASASEAARTGDIGSQMGLLPRQRIQALVRRRMIQATTEIEASQFQPASLDLRLGAKAYRVRASFLPGRERTVLEQLRHVSCVEVDLEPGAVLERGSVYIVELLESLRLPKSVAAAANPKSSAGRLDLFTRLITDRSEIFDHVESGYEGPLYAEISPRTFPVKVRRGSRLNQIRFRRRNASQDAYIDFRIEDRDLRSRHADTAIVDGDASFRNGLLLRLNLSGGLSHGLIGYRAQRYTDIIDVDRVGAYDVEDYWEPIRPSAHGGLILDPNQFYILASRERIRIPPDLAAEMVPIDPMMGEFRVHYAGFFDPGFGYVEGGEPSSRAVLEVRSHEVPFYLSDGQIIGRLVFEKISETPDILYGQSLGSNYQSQDLKLSKHFRAA